MGIYIDIMTKTNGGGLGNEPFYKSRRFYGALTGLLGIVLGSFGYETLATNLIVVATALTGWSWAQPKK